MKQEVREVLWSRFRANSDVEATYTPFFRLYYIILQNTNISLARFSFPIKGVKPSL
jgi:hypothetical protein